ncbi:tRNA (adenine(22)-N(1))-methyltransferase TrmK [Halobacillus shinanisalinarum]|uniref:tRNA (Adenine(22)-N(1))-methyltransferase TrmK n=1 Tax=Halobacillus shinanisalinarum TaxID=2932258 RepID=A0ABY4GZZ2_9BACI|nr:tRNA (adenine(22)-N(1))-methyltransferase TrmK [Halobacillus shinanisalinarum]UOQ93761.1 tRNA (adenine(22)-N(1))-methyltransferase TrmK [Halobacillus shinanisalinarum]
MNVTQLSLRLKKVAEYLPSQANFADIGSDHAYLPSYVCLHDRYAKAVAGEVNHGPYQSALQEVAAHQLDDRIDVRLGDGLHVLKDNEVEQVVIAGMGGPLVRNILESGKDKLSSVSKIIVQPNIDARSIRRWFYENHYQLVHEAILEENGHIYEILVAEKGDPHQAYHQGNFEKQLWLGPWLMKERSPVFMKKWQVERSKKERILHQISCSKQPDEEKIQSFQKELVWLEEVLEQ